MAYAAGMRLGERVSLALVVAVPFLTWAGPARPGEEEDLPDLARTTCTVSSVPSRAAIWVNGKPTGKVTPAGVNLWAGRTSRVEVRVPGFLPAVATLTPNLHQDTTQFFTLELAVAVHYLSEPSGAHVELDGKRVENAPATLEVSRGRHRFVFSLAGRMPVERVLQADDPTAELQVTLPPSSPLRVKTLPSGADLFVDGKAQDSRSPTTLEVEAGLKHHLTVTHQGFLPATQVVELKEAEPEVVTVTLEMANAPRKIKDCVGQAQGRVRGLEATLQKLRKQQARAAPATRERLAEQLAQAERELGARQAEAGFCSRALEAQ